MVPSLSAALKPSGGLDHAPERHRVALGVSEWPTTPARSLIRTTLEGRADPATVDDMVLVVDELVANPLGHTPGIGVLVLAVDRNRATVQVFDSGANCATKWYELGRGLGIVERLTKEWCAEPTTAGGKAVVAVFAIERQEKSSR
ncbi:ATP-binding protein [Streptomyces sp. NPDC055140]